MTLSVVKRIQFVVHRIRPSKFACLVIAFASLIVVQVRAQIYPARVSASLLETAPYSSTGLVFSEINNDGYRGSAVIARDSRLLYTCAHVLYDLGQWSTDVTFARRWNSSSSPSASQMVAVRGYRYYSSYGGSASALDFSLDFAIGYRSGGASFGPAVGAYDDAGTDLRSATTKKMVLGYPAYIDYTDASGDYYQHRTGPVARAMKKSEDSYHTVSGISTGGGNSGGPVLIERSGKYDLAAILVSGTRTTMGVHGLDSSAATMAKNLLAELNPPPPPTPPSPGSTSKTLKRTNTSAFNLADGATTYSTRTFAITGLPNSITSTKLSIRIDSTHRGDLDVYLRSPAGRIHWIKKHSLSETTDNLKLTDANYTSTFSGSKPNGTWALYMRDYYDGDRARFHSATLTVVSR